MRRFMSFRDFDWALLSMVLLLCTVSVFEIYSATLHTKYVGSHTKQILWITGGVVAMFLFSKIDYHRLLDWVPWAYGFFLLALVAVKAGRAQAPWALSGGSRSGRCNSSPQNGSNSF